MFALYGEGDYESALRAVEEDIGNLDEDDVPTATFRRVCLLAHVGRSHDAVATVADALDRELWFGEAALHAGAGRATHTLKTWRPVTALGYNLFAPASRQLVAHDRGGWESVDQTIADVREQAIDKAEKTVDPGICEGIFFDGDPDRVAIVPPGAGYGQAAPLLWFARETLQADGWSVLQVWDRWDRSVDGHQWVSERLESALNEVGTFPIDF